MAGGGRCGSQTHPPSMGENSAHSWSSLKNLQAASGLSAIVAICMVLVGCGGGGGMLKSCKFQELSETVNSIYFLNL